MASMEVNKAFAAVLTAGIAFMVSGLVGRIVVHPKPLHEPAIQIGEVAATAPTQAPAAPAPLEPIGPLLANADPQKGEALAKRLCASCHTFNEGGRPGVGPNLYGVVGAPHGHEQGFNYSAALKSKQGPWNYEELNEWLHKPSAYAPGTRMAFAGISNAQQRADVIAYLKSISPNAPPLPEAK
ncbi:MAG: cytochrome c family protein [Acetobacteraceae bacterium]|nr:cytochrome c family protein [Acetobacteraceae bacterium]MDI3305750.1 cytochrome c family protein [Acetobacteraceae bacterium]